MASKRQRKSGTWEFVVRRKGMKTLNMTFDTEKEGDLYCAQLEAKIDTAGGKKVVAERGPLVDMIDAYTAAVRVGKSDVPVLEVLRSEIGGLAAEKLTYSWAEKWIKEMKLTRAPSTVRHRVGALARCLDWAVRSERLGLHPLRSLPRGYASKEGHVEDRDRRLHPGEEDRVRKQLSGAMLMLFDLALESAMRMKEMHTLEWRQVDFAQSTIFLDKTKNGTKRQVPMSSVAIRLLKEYQKQAMNEFVFPWRGDGRVVTAMLSAQWARVFAAAGCPDLRFHDLRHEATSRLFERTQLSDVEIGKITGHKDPRMLARYANLRGSNLASKLW